MSEANMFEPYSVTERERGIAQVINIKTINIINTMYLPIDKKDLEVLCSLVRAGGTCASVFNGDLDYMYFHDLLNKLKDFKD